MMSWIALALYVLGLPGAALDAAMAHNRKDLVALDWATALFWPVVGAALLVVLPIRLRRKLRRKP